MTAKAGSQERVAARGEVWNLPRLTQNTGWSRDRIIRKLVPEGLPVLQRPDTRGGDWLFDTFAVLNWLAERREAETPDGEKIDRDLEEARLARERADQLAMKNAATRGELLPADKVSLAVTSAFARVRTRMLAIPPKAAPRMVGKAQPAEIQAALSDYVEEALRELSETQVVAASAEVDGADQGDSGDI